jgi:hypothetical protein
MPRIKRRVPETSRRAVLNVSKVAENSLVEVLRRLSGANPGTGSESQPGQNREGRGPGIEPKVQILLLTYKMGRLAILNRPVLSSVNPNKSTKGKPKMSSHSINQIF